MPDSTTAAIDRFFDIVDKGADTLDQVFNRTERTKDRLDNLRGKSEVIEVEAKERPPAKPARAAASAAPSTAIVKKPHFYIVEAVSQGRTIFVVTDGGNARTECSTREFAEKLLQALRAA